MTRPIRSHVCCAAILTPSVGNLLRFKVFKARPRHWFSSKMCWARVKSIVEMKRCGCVCRVCTYWTGSVALQGSHVNIQRRNVWWPVIQCVFCLSVQGLVYTNTDVEEVHDWIVKHFSDHPLFCRVSDEELVRIPLTVCLLTTFVY